MHRFISLSFHMMLLTSNSNGRKAGSEFAIFNSNENSKYDHNKNYFFYKLTLLALFLVY